MPELGLAKLGAIYTAILTYYDRLTARQRDPQSRQHTEQQKATFQAWYDKSIQAISHGGLPAHESCPPS